MSTLAIETGATKYSNDPVKAVKELRKKCSKLPVIIIKDIHRSLFQSDHLLHLADFYTKTAYCLLLLVFTTRGWISFLTIPKQSKAKPIFLKKKSGVPLWITT